MKFYFGQVPNSDIENFGAEGLYYNEGEFYYYCVEFGTNPGGLEDIVLRDTVGRMVPVATEHLRELATVLVECNNMCAEIQGARELIEDLQDMEATASVVGTDIDYN